jgi:hypothetical protein
MEQTMDLSFADTPDMSATHRANVRKQLIRLVFGLRAQISAIGDSMTRKLFNSTLRPFQAS